SNSLQCIYPIMNGSKDQIEAVLDSGSQIISMNKRHAVGVGLTWDPEIIISMMSVNGELNPTGGMARNVPCTIGDIVVHFQIHVIEDAPYDMLIGRPFGTLVQTRVENFKDGGQQLTLTDLNDGHHYTIGTYARGKGIKVEPLPDPTLEPMDRPKEEKVNDTNFHSSMI
ncbi:hypothetical protein GYMLUDRAFT_179768, partial [Collybiopsis luxurians FD-317 M1]